MRKRTTYYGDLEERNVRYSIEPMSLENIPQVQEIERESFPTTWPPNVYRRELQDNRIAQYIVAKAKEPISQAETSTIADPNGVLVNSGVRMSESAQQAQSRLERLVSSLKKYFSPEESAPQSTSPLILGFAGLWFMIDEAHLTTIAVRRNLRHQGIGEKLLISIIDIATERGAEVVTLEVRASSDIAQNLYKKYGFVTVGRRPGYYSDTFEKEDAMIMTTEKITTASYQARLQQLKRQHAERWGQD